MVEHAFVTSLIKSDGSILRRGRADPQAQRAVGA
jgi:hypothetical protein